MWRRSPAYHAFSATRPKRECLGWLLGCKRPTTLSTARFSSSRRCPSIGRVKTSTDGVCVMLLIRSYLPACPLGC